MRVEFASGDVPLHLLIPLVVLPAMQPRREFGAFFERKVFNRFLNLLDAHDLGTYGLSDILAIGSMLLIRNLKC